MCFYFILFYIYIYIIFFFLQVFLSMLVKVIFLDLPLWHRILVLEILRVTSMVQHIHVHFYGWNIEWLISIPGFSFHDQNFWNLIGVLCGGTDIAGSLPELWYVSSNISLTPCPLFSSSFYYIRRNSRKEAVIIGPLKVYLRKHFESS
jgi:hypothetical protein